MEREFVDKGDRIEFKHGVTCMCDRKVRSFRYPMPTVGQKYRFFDDGKTGYSRRYIAECLEIIPFDKADEQLKEAWLLNVQDCPWLYHTKTDYFIKCSISSYDNNPVYFVRQRSGEWFSIDYPNWWMSGVLDVRGDYFTRAGWDESDWSCRDEGTAPKEE